MSVQTQRRVHVLNLLGWSLLVSFGLAAAWLAATRSLTPAQAAQPQEELPALPGLAAPAAPAVPPVPASHAVHNVNGLGAFLGEIVFAEFNNELYYVSDDLVYGQELWRTDSSTAGTRLVKDISPGVQDTNVWLFLGEMDGRLYFIAYPHGSSSSQVWKTDGTPAGTQFTGVLVNGSWEYYTQILGGAIYFSQYDASNDCQLYTSDGTLTNTIQLTSFENTFSCPRPLGAAGGMVFFASEEAIPDLGEELWVTDGTPGGTHFFLDLNPGNASSQPTYVGMVGAEMIFQARKDLPDANYTINLWKTNGTLAGTALILTDLWADASWLDLSRHVASLQGVLYFSGDGEFINGHNNIELWRTDGTTAGTWMVKDINPGLDKSSYPDFLAATEDYIFFSAYHPDSRI